MQYYENWWEEKRSAYLYHLMAEMETQLLHKKLFQELEQAANKQASLWEAKMHASHASWPHFRPDTRTRIVAWLIRRFGTQYMHYILSAMKIRGMSIYQQYHNEHKHTSLSASSNLRAAIFGINDGLVSNMSLILGISGAAASPHMIVITGIAGLLAGACSMAAGEYVSVRSQREMFEYQIALEKKELEEYPEEEMEELSFIYQARGISKEDADKLGRFMVEHPDIGLNTLAREELGLDPDDLVSPVGAMVSSFVAFSIGAVVPLLPFLWFHSPNNLFYSMGITALTLFSIGAIMSLFTNRSALVSGLRMLVIGGVAGAITYSIGHVLGIDVH